MPMSMERHKCESCQLLRINGVVTHEIGCPDAWKCSKPECKWCGEVFVPETKFQAFCCEDCATAFFG